MLFQLLNNWAELTLHPEPATCSSFVSIPNGIIDEVISSPKFMIVIELKHGWKTSPGQLNQYFDYASSNRGSSFLVFITPSKDDVANKWIIGLFSDQRWRHRTWASLHRYLKSTKLFREHSRTPDFLNYLESESLHVESSHRPQNFGLDVPELGIESSLRRNLETEKDYKHLFRNYASKSLPHRGAQLARIEHLLSIHKRVALTCFEANALSCHRHKITGYFESLKNWRIRIIHI